jgi:hypothetical protein
VGHALKPAAGGLARDSRAQHDIPVSGEQLVELGGNGPDGSG